MASSGTSFAGCGGEGFGGLVNGGGDLVQAEGQERMLTGCERGDAGQRGVDSVVERLLLVGGFYARSVTVIGHIEDSGEWDAGAAVLGFLLAQTFSGELDESGAEDRVVGSLSDA